MSELLPREGYPPLNNMISLNPTPIPAAEPTEAFHRAAMTTADEREPGLAGFSEQSGAGGELEELLKCSGKTSSALILKSFFIF